jgi:transcriptional regulator with XRE-family HTH domain
MAMKTLDEKLKKVDPARRRKIEARVDELIAEEMSLRDLRQAHKFTQQKIARALHIGQDGVSRLEKRTDLLLSTLRGYVEAMGGRLSIVADFPDRPRVIISGLTDIETIKRSRREEDQVVHC